MLNRGAEFSADRTYRYRLWRAWSPGPRMLFVLLNPSTADADVDDQTVRRCVGYARRAEMGGVELVNLFAYRATDPRELLLVEDPVGPHNDRIIAGTVQGASGPVVAAWSEHGHRHRWRVRQLLEGPLAGVAVQCIGTVANGHPRHPSRGVYQDLCVWSPPKLS